MGPRRGDDKKRAFEDLVAIRDAATEETTRMGALQAMKRAADRLKGGNEADAGGVEQVQNGFRARIRFSKDGLATLLNGPRRSDERRAKRDLELITAAAADVPDRAERFEAMDKEAHRLQDYAGHGVGAEAVRQAAHGEGH
jgi:hypothetical protein